MQHLTPVLKDMPAYTLDAQLQAIKALQDTLEHWVGDTSAPNATNNLPCWTLSIRNGWDPRVPTATPMRPPAPRVQRLVQNENPRVQPISTGNTPYNHNPTAQRLCSQSAPNQLEPTAATDKPVDHSNRPCTTQQALRVEPLLEAQQKYPAELINLWCTPRSKNHTEMPVLDNETGESLEYCQLCRHPKYKYAWNTYYSNELRRICQCVVSGTKDPHNQRVKGTETFRVIKFDDIPQDRRKEICLLKY